MMQARKPGALPDEAQPWEAFVIMIGVPLALFGAAMFIYLLYATDIPA